ncbi:MAG: LPS assembly lipoprotein LptE [Dysgonamonadaceae bacterium]|jgi:hypothetical protein|nr:LPS assembly lipoprotein LptE [Dysgonamonadaceae bacterium]
MNHLPNKNRKNRLRKTFFQSSSVLFIAVLFYSCSASYSFQGGKINYNLIKTISIYDFPNRSPLVYPTLEQVFNQELRNKFVEQTRLVPVSNGGDIEIEGEITGYNMQGMAVKEDAFASRTRLTITVRIKYINNKEADSDVEQTFSAFQEYDSNDTLDPTTQENLNRQIVEELIDMIYNATVANW